MPSAAHQLWTTDRLVRVRQIAAQCVATTALVPANPTLADENLRGWVMLLSAHFQGFCRDLYTEASQQVVAVLPTAYQVVVQNQFSAGRKLDRGNPTLDNLEEDFDRLGVSLRTALKADAGGESLKRDLAALNDWRNKAAHRNTMTLPALGPGLVAGWVQTCDELAGKLNALVYTELAGLLGQPPWT